MENFEKLFDPNIYTEKSMPFLTAVCKFLDTNALCAVSDDISACRDKYENLHNSFWNSLNDKQKKMYQKFNAVSLEEAETDAREHFNRGVYFGIMLMLDVFGEKAVSK